MDHPEDSPGFARSEQERLAGVGTEPARLVSELDVIRANLKRIETDLALNAGDPWNQVEDIGRQISRIDRLVRAIGPTGPAPPVPPGPPDPPRPKCAKCGHSASDHYRGSGSCQAAECLCVYYRSGEVA